MSASIAIVADYRPDSRSHMATDEALRHSARSLEIEVKGHWIPTATLSSAQEVNRLGDYDGIWIGPGSPYESMEGALEAIRFGRERGIPLLGTCGGFQHIILEYARNVLGIKTADHEESAPGASPLFISRLACSLAGRTMTIHLHPGSRLAAIYRSETAEEEYLCNFGVNPEYVDALRKPPLKIAASDAEAEVRAVELAEHPFFVGTLFLPQHRSIAEKAHPLVTEFVKSATAP